MSDQGTSRSRHLNVIRSSVPQPVIGGVHLPGSDVEIRLMDNSVEKVWHLVGFPDPQAKLKAFEPLLDASTFDLSAIDQSLKHLRRQTSLQDEQFLHVLFYGGFIIDWLYGFHQKKTDVQKKKIDAQSYDYAARLCYLLICFWQERSSHDDQALLALPMLWRSYWLALNHIDLAVEGQRQQLPRSSGADADLQQWVKRSHEHAWLSGWIGHTATEQTRALRAWQDICLKDNPIHLRFFEELLCPWERRCIQAIPPDTWWQRLGRRVRQRIAGDDQGFCQFSAWQGLREREVNDLIWDRHQLRFADMKLAVERRRLRYFMTQWYLPRYDVCKAQRLHMKLAWVERDWLSLAGTPVLGFFRLYAAIGAGYVATALQGDTWKILYKITTDSRGPLIPLWIWVALILVLTTLGYLTNGIARRTGIGVWHALRRGGLICVSGEICAILIGGMLTWLLAPMIEIEDQMLLCYLPTWLAWLSLILLYAQLALFFGIFIQLLFDEKPTTAPIDAP